MQSIQELVERALAHIGQADSAATLEQARVQYLGKSGELTGQMKLLGGLAPEERKPFGQAVNSAKNQLEEAIDQRRAALQEAARPASRRQRADFGGVVRTPEHDKAGGHQAPCHS